MSASTIDTARLRRIVRDVFRDNDYNTPHLDLYCGLTAAAVLVADGVWPVEHLRAELDFGAAVTRAVAAQRARTRAEADELGARVRVALTAENRQYGPVVAGTQVDRVQSAGPSAEARAVGGASC